MQDERQGEHGEDDAQNSGKHAARFGTEEEGGSAEEKIAGDTAKAGRQRPAFGDR
ncbi:hypothetical protein D3C83_280220 [compost metagenome]